MRDHLLYLYGGDQPWDSSLWVTSDDRVRGGASVSRLEVLNPERARFRGRLDTTALGGAGFASQRSAGRLAWDLSSYGGGLVVGVLGAGGAEKRYLVTLKDDIPPRRDDGREGSGVSWEAEFRAGGGGDDGEPEEVRLAWGDFVPTYRGRKVDGAKPLDLSGIKRIGLMMRSFFGEQEGDFSLDLHYIAARKEIDDRAVEAAGSDDESDEDVKDRAVARPEKPSRSW